MLWSSLFFAGSVAAAAVSSATFTQGVAPSPFPTQAANARVKIDSLKSCKLADDTTQARNIQLAAWVECSVLSFYPYPRTAAANDTDWVPGFQATFAADFRGSFNNTRYNRDGWLQIYTGFSKSIGQNYGTGFQTWRDYYVASPDSWGGRGGVVTTQGFNGGVLKNSQVAFHAPNAGYFVVKEIDGKRQIAELREHSTLPSSVQLPQVGQLWPCQPAYEVCS